MACSIHARVMAKLAEYLRNVCNYWGNKVLHNGHVGNKEGTVKRQNGSRDMGCVYTYVHA